MARSTCAGYFLRLLSGTRVREEDATVIEGGQRREYERCRESRRNDTSDEDESDLAVNIRDAESFRGAQRVEGGVELRIASRTTGIARYFAVGTHRGHISLDLAKQTEHPKFKYDDRGTVDLRREPLTLWATCDVARGTRAN